MQLAAARNALAGVDLTWVNGGPIKLPQVVLRMLGGASRDGGRWQRRLRALIADPETELVS